MTLRLYDELEIRRELKFAHVGQSLAEKTGTPTYLITDMIEGRKDISVRVLNAIGFERVTRYVKRTS